MDGAPFAQTLGRDPQACPPRIEHRRAPRLGERIEEHLGPRRASLRFGQRPEEHQRIVQLVRVAGIGAALALHARDGLGVQRPEVGGRLRVEPPPARDRLRSPLLEGRVVEERVGPRVQRALGEG